MLVYLRTATLYTRNNWQRLCSPRKSVCQASDIGLSVTLRSKSRVARDMSSAHALDTVGLVTICVETAIW